MAGFECRAGECIKCCTDPRLKIPMTLPDLYRACMYAKEVEGRYLTIPQAFKELCDSFMFFPDPEDRGWVMPVPKSKIPCPYVDTERMLCTIHNTHQHIACRHYPEGMLIEAMPGFEDSEENESFWRNLECMRGVSLTAEREMELKDLCDLASREVKLTGNLLNNKFQPVRGNRSKIEDELVRRIGFYNRPEFVKNLIQNMSMNRMQERYMELFGIESPDYTARLVPEAPDDKTAGVPSGKMFDLMMGSKTGRNDPCPCGSGSKYKKCCGGP